MLTITVWCLLRFPLVDCFNKKNKKLLKRLPKRIKKLLKNYQKEAKSKKKNVKSCCYKRVQSRLRIMRS